MKRTSVHIKDTRIKQLWFCGCEKFWGLSRNMPPTQAFFVLVTQSCPSGEKDCVTSPRNVCVGGYREMDPGYNSTAPNRPSAQWYYITHAGTQVAQLDFQNKGRSRWTGTSSFVSEVPLCNLRPTMYDFLPRDRIGQRACCHQSN